MTQPEVDEILKCQGGSCGGCGCTLVRGGKKVKANMLCVDHDHETGKIRGLLCHACNRTLGFVKDRPDVLRALADYLER